MKCAASPLYFLDHYGQIYDPTARDWIPFRLWQAQEAALELMLAEQLVAALKARQLGLTWLVLGLILWLMIFRPAAKALIFSRREEEAIYLLGEERLRGMYGRLPAWLTATMHAAVADPDAARTWALANGSVAHCFPSNAGDSYTATFALADEFDLLASGDQNRLLRSVKPTIEAGGKLVLLSRSDKTKPDSEFKRIYLAGKARAGGAGGSEGGGSPWRSLFLPWHAHPGRDAAWYDRQRADSLDRTGSLDDLHEQYPATDAEALAPRTLDKRIAPAWLEQCYVSERPLVDLPAKAPSIPGFEVYRTPRAGRRYVVGADPAEGNPTSDDSALAVLDWEAGEEVASLAGKLQPSVLAAHADRIGRWYNAAAVMVERNNHGHAVIMWLAEHSRLKRLDGHDGHEGWLSSQRGKTLLYDACADAFRNRETVLHGLATFVQLASIEGATLRAPEGQHDDRADAYALACAARARPVPRAGKPAAGGDRGPATQFQPRGAPRGSGAGGSGAGGPAAGWTPR